MKRRGPKSAAQTPAPKSERIKGSKVNKKGSAASKSSGASIRFSEAINEIIKDKVREFNAQNPKNKVSVATAKAVVRRGMGAYSATHRPTISGGAPNSRTAWGIARLNAFLKKKSGGKVKAAYIQDDDLLFA
jgi:hypothetical protein